MKPIVCRPDQRLWFLAAASLLMSLAFILGPSLDTNAPQERGLIVLSAIVGLAFLVGTFYIADELIRGEIRADDAGLSWCNGLSRRKTVRWDEIEDFYRTAVSTVYVVKTTRGKLELNQYHVGIQAIIDLVPQRAATAKASAWEMRGYRRGEAWEKTLPMWSKAQNWTAPLVSGALLLSVALLILLSIYDEDSARATREFGPLETFPLILGIVFFGTVAAGVVSMIAAMWRERRFAYENRAQVLYLNNEGLIFESGADSIRARWDEIERIDKVKGPIRLRGYRVVTRHGEFDLWRLSSDQKMVAQFRARCEHYAPAAFESLRASETEQLLSSEIDAPPARADGAQVFTFRTRSNRLFVATTSFLLFFAPLLYLILVYNDAIEQPFAPSWLLFGAMCGFAVAVSGALWAWFARAKIVVAAGELRIHAPFGATRIVELDMIDNLGADMWGRWVRANGRKTYWMRALSPARKSELEAILEIHWLLQT